MKMIFTLLIALAISTIAIGSVTTRLPWTVKDDALPDGDISYRCTLQSGPTNILLSGDIGHTNCVAGQKLQFWTTVTFFSPGIYVFKMWASDGEKESFDTMTVTVNSTPSVRRPKAPRLKWARHQ